MSKEEITNSNYEKLSEEFKNLQPCPGLERFDSEKSEISFDLRY
jgi:hypothetical protein